MGKTNSIPAAVVSHLQLLGRRIRIARKRRGWSVEDLAGRARVNRNTLTALELGKPGVSWGAFATVLWILGLDRGLERLADPDTDAHGKALELARAPKRVRKSGTREPSHDF